MKISFDNMLFFYVLYNDIGTLICKGPLNRILEVTLIIVAILINCFLCYDLKTLIWWFSLLSASLWLPDSGEDIAVKKLPMKSWQEDS